MKYDHKENAKCDHCNRVGRIHFVPNRYGDEMGVCTPHAAEIIENRRADGWIMCDIEKELIYRYL